MERFFQFERRTAWRIGREFKTRDTHIKRRVVRRVGVTGVTAARRNKEDMHHRTFWRLVVCQHAHLTQRSAQRNGELAAKLHQLFAFVGVSHFNTQIATLLHHTLQHAGDRGNTIFWRQIGQQFARGKHLTGKNQRAER
ncbi:hypothetical protein D3C72_1770950 [compost metagenome]